MHINQIASEALQLNPKDRATLAMKIWESLEDPYISSQDISDEEAIGLAIERDKEIESGKVEPISHKDLMSRLRRNAN
ncbi:MAG: addiction module protein [Campylobacterales bacterium]|nr:addiction module protein [Campylobacterales bacterium]